MGVQFARFLTVYEVVLARLAGNVGHRPPPWEGATGVAVGGGIIHHTCAAWED